MLGYFISQTHRRYRTIGGGGLLRGLDRRLGTETQLRVTVAQDPMSCVALGVGRVLDELELLKKVAMPA